VSDVLNSFIKSLFNVKSSEFTDSLHQMLALEWQTTR